MKKGLFYSFLLTLGLFCGDLLSLKAQIDTAKGSDLRSNGVFIRDAFLTGASYKEMSDSQRLGYVMGVFDGIKLSPWWGGDLSKDEAVFHIYQLRVSNVQLLAVFDKFLENNPNTWHKSAHTLLLAAMKESFKPPAKLDEKKNSDGK